MTREQVEARIAERPEMCQEWVSAYPLGDDEGMFYLSSIVDGPERIGTVHIYIWSRGSMRNCATASKVAFDMMREERLDRLVGEVEVSNTLALRWASKVGFHTIGTVRQRKDGDGNFHDVILFDALPGDFKWEH